MANRHGLIAGATGTGKTVTLQRLAERFSRVGTPVFMADIKGDLSGLAAPAEPGGKIAQRLEQLGLTDYQPRAVPTLFWDLFGERGHPVRTTISELGPLLLANIMNLNDTQTGILYGCFRIADDQGLLLLDLKDLRALLSWVTDNARTLSKQYGSLPGNSLGAIQRRLMVLEQEGAERFFGEPALNLRDLMQKDFSGQGVVSILDATRLIQTPRLYATFLLWLLSELFENLPEIGDPTQPVLVFFFDEAHLLFNSAPRALLEKIDQLVRLIRSKGVGVYFISQNPLDIPDSVLGQLGNRVQHALRAFTPRDEQAVKAAARTFRANPGFDTQTAITQLGVGEALVSVLDEQGSPTQVEITLICPPESRIGPLSTEERASRLKSSPLAGRYEPLLDRDSAFEMLARRVPEPAAAAATPVPATATPAPRRASRRDSLLESVAKSTLRSIGSQLGRRLVRGLLGSLLGGR
ncbi:ATP-binding protein [Oceanisphaera psychrotolerans]|uniref:ATP-binding protein n=2 Tax=Oceanisphaera psychrotolerans TaxID=1414654 RepID=A0A1J4QFI9_9GAMM|nr:ATP-binding protein [Oceanisphaera psychrotolerans]